MGGDIRIKGRRLPCYVYQEIKKIIFGEHERVRLLETAVEIIDKPLVFRDWSRWIGPLRIGFKMVEGIDRFIGPLVKRI